LDQLADRLCTLLDKKSLIALQGPMGVGKTELVKKLCAKFKSETVASPTFAIHHRYSSQRGVIDHLDLYRLENEDELETTGFWDLLTGEEGLVLIEWPERMNLDHLPFSWQVLMLEFRFGGSEASSERQIKVFQREIKPG
jgi:tRNA threonylcarbamoyladenosine biosynthesis protein TsaE